MAILSNNEAKAICKMGVVAKAYNFLKVTLMFDTIGKLWGQQGQQLFWASYLTIYKNNY